MSDMLVAEQARLATLRGYDVLDTDPEADFDDIAMLAAQLCRAPAAAVSLIGAERQFLKARVGLDPCDVARAHSFCSRAMLGDDVMLVPDARLDPRFRNNPQVVGRPYLRFYAGAPLISPEGQPLGSLCVIDYQPRTLGRAEIAGLRTLARHVIAQLELRQYARGLDIADERLRDADRIKDEFLSRVTREVLGDARVGPVDGKDFQARIRRNSDRLMSLVDDMLLAAQAGQSVLRLHKTVIDLAELARTTVTRNEVLAAGRGLRLSVRSPEPVLVHADEQRLAQAFERLVLNAIKFTPHGEITVGVSAPGDDALVEVRDTGIGISRGDQQRVLAPFRRATMAGRAEVPGAGLGLSIVKAIVDADAGVLTIDSDAGRGATVSVRLARHDAR